MNCSSVHETHGYVAFWQNESILLWLSFSPVIYLSCLLHPTESLRELINSLQVTQLSHLFSFLPHHLCSVQITLRGFAWRSHRAYLPSSNLSLKLFFSFLLLSPGSVGQTSLASMHSLSGALHLETKIFNSVQVTQWWNTALGK